MRASFNRDSSFECSTVSEASYSSAHLPISTPTTFNRDNDNSFECSAVSEARDLSAHLPITRRFTVCSTPNFKFFNRPQTDTAISSIVNGEINARQNYSSDLFASYAGFESSFNGSQENATKKHSNSDGESSRLRLFSLPKTPFKSKILSNEFVSLGRGARRRKRKTAAEFTLQDEICEENGSPGETCDLVAFMERRYSNYNPKFERSDAPSRHVKTGNSINIAGGRASIVSSFNTQYDNANSLKSVEDSCVTIPDGSNVSSANVDVSASKGIPSSLQNVDFNFANSADSLDESQFFRRLRNKPLRPKSGHESSVDVSRQNSTSGNNSTELNNDRDYTKSTQKSVRFIDDSNFSLSKVQSMEESCTEQALHRFSSDHEHTSSQSCIDVSSERSSSFIECPKLHDGVSSSLMIKSEATGSFSSIDDPLNSFADTSSIVQSSCENEVTQAPSSTRSHTRTTGCFPPLPHHIFERKKKTCERLTSENENSLDVSSRPNSSTDNDSTISNTESTQKSVHVINDLPENFSLSKVESMGESNVELGRCSDHENSNSSQSCIDLSSDLSASLNYFSKLHDGSSLIKSEAAESFSSIDNSFNSTSDMSSRAQSSCEKECSTRQLTSTRITGCFPPLPRDIIERTNKDTNNTDSISNSSPNFISKMFDSHGGPVVATSLNVTDENDKTTNSTVISERKRSATSSRDASDSEFSETLIAKSFDGVSTIKTPRNSTSNESDREIPNESRLSLKTLPAIDEQDTLITQNENKLNDVSSPRRLSTTKTVVAGDQEVGPRELFSDIGNKINCINVTKRKRNKIVNTLTLPAIMESSAVGLPESECIETGDRTTWTQNDDRKLDADAPSISLHSGKWRRLLSMYRKSSISMRSGESFVSLLLSKMVESI